MDIAILVFFGVSIMSSIVGSICGIGGGVIIKPVLDAVGILEVSDISFLSGCTVLAMSIVSVTRYIRKGEIKVRVEISTALAIGAAAGGIFGKFLFQFFKRYTGNENLIGCVQAFVLILVTVGTLIYTICKKQIRTKRFEYGWIGILVGVLLGILSSFLGIGGGPVNLVVLGYFFSMSTKEAALNSLYIIMFSQTASLIQAFVTDSISQVRVGYLVVMVAGGSLGGMIGSKINKKMDEQKVDMLFIIVMIVIVGINIWNVIKFGTDISGHR